jgi:gentisate 1,2-dioxygenase
VAAHERRLLTDWPPHGTQSPGNSATRPGVAGNALAVVSGTVRASIDGHEDEVLGRGDVLAVSWWHRHVLHGIEDATLLRVTDEPIMAKFGLLRHA